MEKFTDFRGVEIVLSQEAWEHIHHQHAEVSLSLIARALKDPDEVRRDDEAAAESACEFQLYYLYGNKRNEKPRYLRVVVKLCPKGCFIVTAYTVSKIKFGTLVYLRESGL